MTVGAHHTVTDRLGMIAQIGAVCISCSSIPDFERLVKMRVRENKLAIGTHRTVTDRLAMTNEGKPLLSRSDIPHLECPVTGCGNDKATIRTHRTAPDLILMTM